MSDTQHTSSPSGPRYELTAALEAANWQLQHNEDLAVSLVKSGVRHPVYLGSSGTRSALHRDLITVRYGFIGLPSLARTARYLVKRGWYVDTSSSPESLDSWVIPDDFVMEVAEVPLRTALMRSRVSHTGTVEDHDWLMLPYTLVAMGVTHPDFSAHGVDPATALDRDLDEIRERLSSFGEGVWACFLAKRGWTVESKGE